MSERTWANLTFCEIPWLMLCHDLPKQEMKASKYENIIKVKTDSRLKFQTIKRIILKKSK